MSGAAAASGTIAVGLTPAKAGSSVRRNRNRQAIRALAALALDVTDYGQVVVCAVGRYGGSGKHRRASLHGGSLSRSDPSSREIVARRRQRGQGRQATGLRKRNYRPPIARNRAIN